MINNELASKIIIYIFLFLIGTIVGSFLNVVIYRVPKKISLVTPPSKCPICNNRIKAYDLIPIVSYFLLSGKCRYCQSKINILYPIIEFLTGVFTVAIFLVHSFSLGSIFMTLLVYIMIVVFIIDYKYMIIPNGIVITGLVFFIIYFVLKLLLDNILLYNNLIAGAVGFGVMLIIYILGYIIYHKDALGAGDLKIFFVIGLLSGLKLTIMTLVFSIMLAGIWGIFIIITGRKKRNEEMAFGPFIALGTILSIFIGEMVYNWYMGFLI